MAATKKTIPKKAKAPVKKTTAVSAAKQPAKRAARKQSAPAAALTEQESTLTLALVSMFAVLSVLFAVMAYWRYHM
jgi:hypothetical protein